MIRSKIGMWPGVDILAGGSLVILPGSRTDRGEYTLYAGDMGDIPELPMDLALEMQERSTKREVARAVSPTPSAADAPPCLSSSERYRLFRHSRTRHFQKLWDQRKDQGDVSMSGYEYQMAKACFCIGLNVEQTIEVIKWWWRHIGDSSREEKKLRERILPGAWAEVEGYVMSWRGKRQHSSQQAKLSLPPGRGGKYSGATYRVLWLLWKHPTWSLKFVAHAAGISYRAAWNILHRFCEYIGNPIDLARPPKRTNTVPVTLTEAEVAVLLHSTNSIREKALISTMAYSGIRNNELCNLRIRDIDIPNGILRMEECKFNKQRDAAVTGECLGLLEEYLSWRKAQGAAKGKPVMPDDLLFVTKRHGNQLQSQDVRKIVRVLAKRAGIERRVWPHLMRHSLATNMANRGAHMLTIKDQLGHVYVQSTMIYVHRSQHAHTADYRQHAPSYL